MEAVSTSVNLETCHITLLQTYDAHQDDFSTDIFTNLHQTGTDLFCQIQCVSVHFT